MEEKKRFRIRLDLIGLVGILVGLAGIYTYYRGTKPHLEVQVESITSVVDVNEKISGLGLTFNGEDLLGTNRVLKIYSISLKNTGNESLRKGDFDDTSLAGVGFRGASVLSAQVVPERTTPTPYLRKHAILLIARPDSVFLNPVILDAGDRVGIKVVAIHSSSVNPSVISLGKVVGQDAIPVVFDLEKDDVGIWEKAISGGVGVNLLRLPIFFLGFVIVLVVAIGVPASISDWRTGRKRKAVVKIFMRHHDQTPSIELFIKEYEKNGLWPLTKLHMQSSKEAPVVDDSSTKSHSLSVRRIVEVDGPSGIVFEMSGASADRIGKRIGLISDSEKGATVDQNVAKELEEFINFVSRQESASRD